MSAKHIVIDARIRQSSTGRYIDRLVEHLQTLDTTNRYTVLLKPGDPWQPTAANFSKVVAPFAQFSFNPLDQIKFPQLLRSLKPDLVHFPMNQQPVFYNGTIVTSTMDLTMLRFTRPGRASLPVYWMKMAGYRYLFRSSVRKSRWIIAISEFVKKDLEAHYPYAVGKTTVTLCATEPPLPGKAEQPAGVRGPFIMHVGSPFPHKNIERLIQAFEVLRDKNPELQLVLSGKKEFYFEQLQKQIDASPAREAIVVTGFVGDNELKWLYQNAAAYVLPSLSEGFGLPGLEAMVHGCPVASSDATCLPEIYGDAAHYFDPLDTQDIAAKVNELINNPDLRKQLIKKGNDQVKKFSWPRMAQQTLGIYQHVLRS